MVSITPIFRLSCDDILLASAPNEGHGYDVAIQWSSGMTVSLIVRGQKKEV